MDLTENIHFVMTIVAPRESGKSYLTKHMLNAGFKERFDVVYILCPSLDFNDDYDDFLEEDHFHFYPVIRDSVVTGIIHKYSKLKKSLKNDHVYDCPNALIVFDDCIDSGIMNFKGVVDTIAARGRHINISVIIMSQRLSAVSRTIRLNSNFVILFSPHSISELEQFVEQFIPRYLRRGVIDALSAVYSEEFNFLLLDNTEKMWSKKLKYSDTHNFIENKTFILEIKPTSSKRSRDSLQDTDTESD